MLKDIQTAMDRIPSPVGLVVAGWEQQRKVITVSWFTQVSQHPPLLAVSISPHSSITPIVAQQREFVLALLGGDQEDVARTCGHHADLVPDKFSAAGLSLEPARQVKTYLIREALVNLECVVSRQTLAGDHCIYVAEVTQAHITREAKPLIFADRDLFPASQDSEQLHV